MSIKITDRWRNDRQRATPAQVFAFFDAHPPARRPDSERIVERVFTLCANGGIDFALAIARIADETGATSGDTDRFFVSPIYADRLNIGGLGVTDGGDEMLSFATPEQAADAYMAHLFTYVLQPTYNILGVTKDDDPRFEATPVEWRGSVETLDDLRGKWFTNPNGAINSAKRGNQIFPGIADQSGDEPPVSTLNMTRGLIPLPPHDEDYIDVTQRNQSRECRGYDYLGDRPDIPKFLVLHKSQCPPGASNSGYFHQSCCPALTDWEVVATTGQMRRFVGRGGSREPSGWANGVVSNPYGDALKWLNLHGWDLNTVNRDGEAIEITGWFPAGNVTQDTPMSEAALQNVAQWIASRAHDYGITYETFPIIPNEDNRSYITWHQEWTIGTGKTCPGPWVMNKTEDIFARARAIMMEAQTGTGPKPTPKPPTYASPIVPDWLTADLEKGYPTDHTWNGIEVFGVLRTYEAIKRAKRLQKPDPKSPVVGPPIEVREQFRANYRAVATDAKGTKRGYILTPYATWVSESALTPRVSIRRA